MRIASLSSNNIRIFNSTAFFRSLYFTAPIWIVFLQKSISTAQISLIVSYVFFVQLILELPTGAFADIFGRKVSVLLANLLDAVYFISLIYASTLPQFLLAATISGLAESLRSGASEALLYDSLKEDGLEASFTTVMGKQSSIFQAGLIVSSLLGGFLYHKNIYLPFILASIAHVCATIFSFFFTEPTIDSQKFTLKRYVAQIVEGAREAFKNQETKLMSLYYITVGSITWMVMTYYVDFLLIDLGFNDITRGVISGLARLANILLITKFLSNDRILSKQRTLIFFPVLLVSSLLPGFLLHSWWGIPFVAGAMLGSTARWILLGKYTNQVFDSRYRATAISTLSMAIGLIYVFFTLISGPIMEYFGGSKTIFSLLGLISLVTIPPLAQKLIKIDNRSTVFKH